MSKAGDINYFFNQLKASLNKMIITIRVQQRWQRCFIKWKKIIVRQGVQSSLRAKLTLGLKHIFWLWQWKWKPRQEKNAGMPDSSIYINPLSCMYARKRTCVNPSGPTETRHRRVCLHRITSTFYDRVSRSNGQNTTKVLISHLFIKRYKRKGESNEFQKYIVKCSW